MKTRPESPRVVAIIQARMGSTRLPQKSMMHLGGAPLIMRVIERVKRCSRLDEVVLATTEKSEDDILEEMGREAGVAVFRGSENDLIDRYYQAAKLFAADVVVRIPGDNPVPEPVEIERIVAHHLQTDNDMSSNYANVAESPVVEENGYPDGIGAEVYDFDALARVWETVTDPRNREHPHTCFFEYPDTYKVGTIECPPEFRRPDIILDINTPSEYEFLAAMYSYLYPRNSEFTIFDVIDWYDNVYMPGRP